MVDCNGPAISVNQRVRVKAGRWAFSGVTGIVVNPPAVLAEVDPVPWTGHYQYNQRRGKTVLLYWVRFDVPTDDGSGDGPYREAAIEEEFLEVI